MWYNIIIIIAKSLSTAKMKHYSNKVKMCKNDPKSLFQLTNSLLVNQQQKKLPHSDDDHTLKSAQRLFPQQNS